MISSGAQAALGYLSSIVCGKSRGHNVENNDRTFQTRKKFFAEFCRNFHLGNNPTLGSCSQQDRNDVLACYLVCLVLGQTVLARCVKTDTLKRCLCVAADWSIANDPVLVNPTMDATGEKCHRVEKLLKEQT